MYKRQLLQVALVGQDKKAAATSPAQADADYAVEDLLTIAGEPWESRRNMCAATLGDRVTCSEDA